MALMTRPRRSTTNTAESVQRALDSNMGRITAAERREKEVATELPKAQQEVDGLGGRYHLAQSQGTENAPAVLARLEAARSRRDALKAEQMRLDNEKRELYAERQRLGVELRVKTILGGRDVDVPALPDWRADDQLKALLSQESTLQTRVNDANQARTRLGQQQIEADGRAKRLRIDALKGKATQSAADEAKQESAALVDQLAALDREIAELTEAAEDTRRERDARETTLRAERVPALMAAYRPIMAAIFDKLVDVAVEMERARPLYGALVNLGVDGTRLISPWEELNLANPMARINLLFELARERGFIGGEHDAAA